MSSPRSHRSRPAVAVVAAALTVPLIACSTPPVPDWRTDGGTSPSPSGSASTLPPSPTPSPEHSERVFLPRPDVPLPRRPRVLAARLVRVTNALMDSIELWQADRDRRGGRPTRRVVLQALYQQRIYGLMTRNRALGDRTLAELDGRLARSARAHVDVARGLRRLTTPVRPPVRMRTRRPEPARRLMRYFRAGERRFGVDREVLAAICFVETRFGRIISASSAGAQGPMQFLPSTWDAYGMGGDVHDAHDAILGAANYLRASGAPEDLRRALYAYNHSAAYVDAILAYARTMMRDRRYFFAFYNWQVFVRTTEGVVRITGPGLR